MTRIRVLAVMLIALTFAGCANMVTQPSPAEVPSYGQWRADVKEVMRPAIPWLRNRVKKGDEKLSIVLDIDNTALETHYHPGRPNKPVLAVAQWAHRHNVSVLFVTLRDDFNRDSTMSQLRKAGYVVDGLCMRTTGVETKPRCRQEYASVGYTITANIGNRETDMQGGNYEKRFKLPDYNGRLA